MFDLGEPDFINSDETKWWIDKNVLEYAKSIDVIGFMPYIVETKEGYKTRILINNKKNVIEYETTKLEDMAVHIDILSKIKEYQDDK